MTARIELAPNFEHPDVYGLTYDFKPDGVAHEAGELEADKISDGTGAVRVVHHGKADGTHSSYYFQGQQTPAKPTDCVLLWDNEKECYILHRMASYIRLSHTKHKLSPLFDTPPSKRRRLDASGAATRRRSPSSVDGSPETPTLKGLGIVGRPSDQHRAPPDAEETFDLGGDGGSSSADEPLVEAIVPSAPLARTSSALNGSRSHTPGDHVRNHGRAKPQIAKRSILSKAKKAASRLRAVDVGHHSDSGLSPRTSQRPPSAPGGNTSRHRASASLSDIVHPLSPRAGSLPPSPYTGSSPSISLKSLPASAQHSPLINGFFKPTKSHRQNGKKRARDSASPISSRSSSPSSGSVGYVGNGARSDVSADSDSPIRDVAPEKAQRSMRTQVPPTTLAVPTALADGDDDDDDDADLDFGDLAQELDANLSRAADGSDSD